MGRFQSESEARHLTAGVTLILGSLVLLDPRSGRRDWGDPVISFAAAAVVLGAVLVLVPLVSLLWRVYRSWKPAIRLSEAPAFTDNNKNRTLRLEVSPREFGGKYYARVVYIDGPRDHPTPHWYVPWRSDDPSEHIKPIPRGDSELLNLAELSGYHVEFLSTGQMGRYLIPFDRQSPDEHPQVMRLKIRVWNARTEGHRTWRALIDLNPERSGAPYAGQARVRLASRREWDKAEPRDFDWAEQIRQWTNQVPDESESS